MTCDCHQQLQGEPVLEQESSYSQEGSATTNWSSSYLVRVLKIFYCLFYVVLG